MTNDQRDGAAVRIPPPLVYVLALALGAALHRWVHPLPFEPPLGVRITTAVALGVFGLGFLSGAIGRFRRTGQNPAPWTATPELIAQGIYRFTRNPMYVGMGLVQASIGVAAANGWMLLFVPLVLAIVQATAIRHEEAYLEGKFGAPYAAYKQRVRRWL